MPFELGLFLAAKEFGSNEQKDKIALIFDSTSYRYRQSLSDISGLDIGTHDGTPEGAIEGVRNWLDSSRGGRISLPGAAYLIDKYNNFSNGLPAASEELNLDANKLTFGDMCRAMELWVKVNTNV
jgi:hypothetical protein